MAGMMGVSPDAVLRGPSTSRPGAAHLVDGVLLVLMMVALSVQGFTLFTLGGMEFTAGHALVGVLGAYAFVRCLVSGRGIAVPPTVINVLLAVFVATTLINMSHFGFGTMILKYVFQYLVLVVMLNFMELLGNERGLRLILLGAWIVLGIVIVNALAHYGVFLDYYARPWDGHPNYPTIFSGGVNMEATWVAMFGVFCRNNRRGWAYLAIALLYSIAVASRAGLTLVALAAFYVVCVRDNRFGKKLWVVLGVAVVVALAVVAVGIALGVPMFDRLLTVGEDGGSQSRLKIWRTALQAFRLSPWTGVGAGKAMDLVCYLSKHHFTEDNVHNYPLQILVDYGIVGFMTFAGAVVAFVVTNARARFRSPFAAFVALYLIGGLIQFRGGELFVGFMLAGLFAFGPDLAGARRVRLFGRAAGEPSTPADGE